MAMPQPHLMPGMAQTVFNMAPHYVVSATPVSMPMAPPFTPAASVAQAPRFRKGEICGAFCFDCLGICMFGAVGSQPLKVCGLSSKFNHMPTTLLQIYVEIQSDHVIERYAFLIVYCW